MSRARGVDPATYCPQHTIRALRLLLLILSATGIALIIFLATSHDLYEPTVLYAFLVLGALWICAAGLTSADRVRTIKYVTAFVLWLTFWTVAIGDGPWLPGKLGGPPGYLRAVPVARVTYPSDFRALFIVRVSTLAGAPVGVYANTGFAVLAGMLATIAGLLRYIRRTDERWVNTYVIDNFLLLEGVATTWILVGFCLKWTSTVS